MYAGHFDFTAPLVQRVPEAWSAAACEALLARVVQERLRNNDVCVLDDAALADDLFASVRRHLPAVMHADGDGGRARVELAGLFDVLYRRGG